MALKTFSSFGVPVVEDWNTYAANPALKYITEVSINAVTTTVSSVFSSTYTNYHLEFSNLRCAAGSTTALLSLSAGAGTVHYSAYRIVSEAGAVSSNNQNGTGYWIGIPIVGASVGTQCSMDILSPNATVDTVYQCQGNAGLGGFFSGGIVTNSTAYTGFSIVGLFSTTIVGTLRIYGYRKP